MLSLRSIWLTASILVLRLCDITTASHDAAPLQLDLTVSSSIPRAAKKQLLLRDGAPITIPSDYSTYDFAIIVNATIGTPPQQIEFILATNAADTVVLAANDSTCASNACGNAVFEASQSKSYQFVNSQFNTTYGDGSAGMGFYATDNFTLGETTVSELQFALLLNGSLNEAILGVGYISLESNPSSYANLPYRLHNQNAIDVNAFSIWFEDASSTSGKLSFGGIDTGKFNGSLETFTVSASDLSYGYTTITMSGVSGTVDGYVTNFANSSADVILDTSASALFLPNTTITQIAQFVGATFVPSIGGYVLEYSAMKNGSTIDIILGSTVIHIPLEYLTAVYNTTYAYLLISATGKNNPNTLGVPFLRNAYTVFDYTHNELSFAPLLKSDQSNVTAISASGVKGLQSTFKTNATSSNTTSTPSSGTSTASTSSASSSHGLAPSAKLGIGLGIGLGVPLLLAAFAAVFFLRRRKLRQEHTPYESYTPTTERYSHPGSSSAGSVFGGLKTKFKAADNSTIPELGGGLNRAA